ncbi:MAG: glycosyltransferase [Candidatus Symbiobacter sp.]|nr:glycosyltransferase [Candidatus Symbiobacter sp.]
MVNPAKIPFLVYRDQLLPASEGFIPRQYCAFTRLAPLFVGTKRRMDGISQLPSPPYILGGNGLGDRIKRAAFKQFGTEPPGFAALVAAEPRLIHAQFGRGGALALPLARRLGIPLVVTFHGGDATKSKHYEPVLGLPLMPEKWAVKGIYLRRLPRLMATAPTLHCVSEFIRQTLIGRGFPPEKLVTLPLGIVVPPLDATRPTPPPLEKNYIFTAGRMVEKKGFSSLLKALALMPPATKLVIAGDGELKTALHREAQTLGLANQVKWVGWQSPDQIRIWLHHAAAVAVPSETSQNGDAEGLPSFLLEAMASARPVVGTRHAGIPEALRHEQNGLLVAERDPAGLAAALSFMLAHPEPALALGRAARTTVEQNFNAATQSQKFENLLQNVMARGSLTH